MSTLSCGIPAQDREAVVRERPGQGDGDKKDASASLENASKATAKVKVGPRPRNPRVLSQGILPVLGTLSKDFINFSLILVFYLCCGSIGSVALLIDKTFNTQLFETFIRFVEYLDSNGWK